MKTYGTQEVNKALADWNLWGSGLTTGIPRDKYIKELARKYQNSQQILVITGPRRSGKSYVMRQFAKYLIGSGLEPRNTLYINFEDPRLINLSATDLLEIVKDYKAQYIKQGDFVVMLDEIQEISGWEKTVRALYETSAARLILSGSNSKLLSGELASSLSGRHVDMRVYPLSFNEYCLFKNQSLSQNQSESFLLNSFLETGGFPLAVLSQNPKEILLTYWNDLLEKDLVKRYSIRKETKFKELAMFYLTNSSNLITYGKLEKSLGINSATAEKYSGYMENAFLMFFPQRFSYKYKELSRNPKKVYCIDTGLQNFAGYNFGHNLGWRMENMVFLELLKSQESQDKTFYYWKNERHQEVDFIVKTGNNLSAIQSCWTAENLQTLEREVGSLVLCLKELNLSTGLVITNGTYQKIKRDGKTIEIVPVLDWLKCQN